MIPVWIVRWVAPWYSILSPEWKLSGIRVPLKKAQETLHEVCMWKAAVPVPPTIWHLHSFSASQVATIDIPSSTPTAQLSIPFSISPRIASKETPFSWENKSNDLKIVVETSAQIDLKLPPRPQPEKVAPHHTAPVVFHAPAPGARAARPGHPQHHLSTQKFNNCVRQPM